jgi:hypothetical protein
MVEVKKMVKKYQRNFSMQLWVCVLFYVSEAFAEEKYKWYSFSAFLCF